MNASTRPYEMLIETAGCLDEEQLAASVARALRKDGMLSITAQSVLAYLEVHGADILGPPVQTTQLEVDFVNIQQRLANRIGAAGGSDCRRCYSAVLPQRIR